MYVCMYVYMYICIYVIIFWQNETHQIRNIYVAQEANQNYHSSHFLKNI